jgi:hypothetical protein
MAGFVVLNNMACNVMANDKLVVFSPFIPIYGVWNGAMHECNYSQRFYSVAHDAAIHAA